MQSYDYGEDFEEEKEDEEEEDDGLEANVFCAALSPQDEDLSLEARVAFHDVDMDDFKREIITPYWARACPEVEVQLVGAKGGV